jgi:hypothetical protein
LYKTSDNIHDSHFKLLRQSSTSYINNGNLVLDAEFTLNLSRQIYSTELLLVFTFVNLCGSIALGILLCAPVIFTASLIKELFFAHQIDWINVVAAIVFLPLTSWICVFFLRGVMSIYRFILFTNKVVFYFGWLIDGKNTHFAKVSKIDGQTITLEVDLTSASRIEKLIYYANAPHELQTGDRVLVIYRWPFYILL